MLKESVLLKILPNSMNYSKRRTNASKLTKANGIDAEDGSTVIGSDETCLFTFTHDQLRVMIHETWLTDERVFTGYHKGEILRAFSQRCVLFHKGERYYVLFHRTCEILFENQCVPKKGEI
jgi:hypothetical protein